MSNDFRFDTCPQCGMRKQKASKTCRNCFRQFTQVVQPDDPHVRYIPLTKGQYAIVDADNYDLLSTYEWYAYTQKDGFRAGRVDRDGHTVFMHRQILGLAYGDPREGDHVNPKLTLDNRDVNLRIATRAQQLCNQTKRKSNTSGYKGVSNSRGYWRATIQVLGKWIFLGNFPTAYEAHLAYCYAASAWHGEFARYA